MSAEDVQNYFKIDDKTAASNNSYYGNPKYIVTKEDYEDLSNITYAMLGLTVDRVKNELLGMNDDLVDPTTNKEFPDSFYEQCIALGVDTTEKTFDIVIKPRIVKEPIDYNESDFNSFVFTHLSSRPIIQVDELVMMFNNQRLITYPDEWIKVHSRYGQVQIQPSLMLQQGISTGINALGLYPAGYSSYPFGLSPLSSSSYGNSMFIPDMMGCTYIAGMLPPDKEKQGLNLDCFIQPTIIAYVAKLAAIEALERWGRLILGAGIASFGVNVDGMSSNVVSTQSAMYTGSTADIDLLKDDMKTLQKAIQSYYGYNIGVLA